MRNARWIIAFVIAAAAVVTYFGRSSVNPLTGETQRVAMSPAAKSPYKFSFHVLADRQTINAFALPGGPIFITEGLLRLLRTESELAGVLGHEIGHVIEIEKRGQDPFTRKGS